MDRADALHLLRRTGFTVRTAELDEIAGLTREVAVDRLLDFSPNTGAGPSPEVNNVEGKRWEQIRDLRLWWIDRMQTSPRQLQEKMVLFWHSHFATSADSGFYAYYAWDQNSLFRAKAVGDFKSLAHDVALGPAMLAYLDNYRNKAGNPNENFARELLELHLLGPENYNESDIPEVAKAWTGYMLDEEKYVHEFHPQHHDYRNKTIFGITRAWNGPQVIDEIITGSKQTASARFIAKKLFEFFAYADPSSTVVNRLADDFIAGGHQIWVLVRNILLSNEFWSAEARKAMVRSPVEFVVACMQGAGSSVAEARPDWRLKTMGMELFDPPNPSGWQQNGFWVSSTAQWAKADFARNLSWKAVNRDFLSQIEFLSVPDAVAIALSLFGVEDASPTTRQALENYLYAERATDEWPQQANLLTLTMMTPDIQVA
ncbi:DUF1800 domain-containing protein [Acidimicrobium ferrooxidans]|uniref:DUF1800 domain-containing protein n=1 Tax=Acidimicrobium ferrooxidans TaxID=53635 RepID=A0ABS3ATS1_9ACTN|nr:DUF1800 domain-containing protein [Acidimicrobium ferrooxidans]